MEYELVRYIPLVEATDRRPRSPEWAVYYRVPADPRIHVVFLRAAEVNEQIARAAVELELKTLASGGSH